MPMTLNIQLSTLGVYLPERCLSCVFVTPLTPALD